MTNAPERLWLATLNEDHAVCIWHKPMAVEYVRVDLIKELEAEQRSASIIQEKFIKVMVALTAYSLGTNDGGELARKTIKNVGGYGDE